MGLRYVGVGVLNFRSKFPQHNKIGYTKSFVDGNGMIFHIN